MKSSAKSTSKTIVSPFPLPINPFKNPNPPCDTSPLLDPSKQFRKNKWKNQLPNLLDDNYIAKPLSTESKTVDVYKMNMTVGKHDFGLIDTESKIKLTLFPATVFGFENIVNSKKSSTLSPGNTFVVHSNQTIKVIWNNQLLSSNNEPIIKHLFPVDTTIHRAIPKVGIPLVVHLHGGLSKAKYDGFPESWFTTNFAETGPEWDTKVYTYENKQESGHLWYHDHALGWNRLNNYAGLLGNYFIRDENELSLIEKGEIPSGKYEYPLTIVDKIFKADGQLWYPSTNDQVPIGAPYPSIIPEFLGDVLTVNGKVWPNLDVEAVKYRFRFLNASDSRFYQLSLRVNDPVNGRQIPFIQIGTEDGLLNKPVIIEEFGFAPAMRQDMVIDFGTVSTGDKVYLVNSFPADAPRELTQLVRFKITSKRRSPPVMKIPDNLRPLLEPLTIPKYSKVRKILMWQTTDEYGRQLSVLGTPKIGGLMWDDPITEKPRFNTTELWEFYNTTPDSHPMHLHGVHFRLLNRQKFSAEQSFENGILSNITRIGKPMPPDKWENGLIDVVDTPKGLIQVSKTNSHIEGVVTRIIVTFTISGEFVFHCHMTSHENFDKMRKFKVRNLRFL